MNEFCNSCGMCCKIIPIKSGDNVMVRDGFQLIDEDFFSGLYELSDSDALKLDEEYVLQVKELFPDIKFYACKHFSEENKCTLKDKPSVCKNFPYSPLALVPYDCECAGEVFMKNEELKRKIRMIKEEMLDYETLIASGDKDSSSYKKIIENLARFITKYKDYGSENW